MISGIFRFDAGGASGPKGYNFNTDSVTTGAMVISEAGNVGIGTTTPQAGLDIKTTGTSASAVIVPRDTVANRPTTAVNGMIRYASDTNNMEAYINGAWQTLAASGGGGGYLPSGGGVLGGNLSISSGGETIGAGGLTVNGGESISGGPLTLNAQSITGVGSNLTGASAMTITAGGTNQNLTLGGSGTGNLVLSPNIGIGHDNTCVPFCGLFCGGHQWLDGWIDQF